MAQGLDGIDRRLDGHDARFDGLVAQIASSAEETRRHFDVVAESLLSTIRLVAEGVLTVDRKVDRLAGEIRLDLARMNRRMLALSARMSPKRRD